MRFPDVIIELLSDTTRAVDTGEKKALYEGLFRTAKYYLYDPWSQEFIGYHLHGMHYREVELDAARRIYSPAIGLYLGIREGWPPVARRRGSRGANTVGACRARKTPSRAGGTEGGAGRAAR